MRIELGPALEWYRNHRMETWVLTAFVVVTFGLAWATVVANKSECEEFMAFARTPADSLQALTNCRMVQARRVPVVVPVTVPR